LPAPAAPGILSAVADEDPLLPYLAAAREGDGAAVGELVRLTQPAVWQVCRALGSPGEEEDLVQETYLRALSALARYRGDAPVRVWLLAIARRVCADHVRRRQRRRRLADRLAHGLAATATPAPEILGDILAGLDPDRREAFVLTQLAGLSYEDAAGVVGCPIGTIRSRVARARADLLDVVTRADAC
jgi:RNA polymerase sigma-70 factor (ECF subfamily)